MLKVIKFNQIIFSPLSHRGIRKQKLYVQNLTIFFDFLSILITINQPMDHIISFSLA